MNQFLRPGFSQSFTLCLLLTIASVCPPITAIAQIAQSIRVGSVMIDDGAGHTVLLTAPSTGTGGTVRFPSSLTFPSTNATGSLTNDGLGNLSWAGGSGSYLPLAGGTMTGAVNGLRAGTTLGTGTPVVGGVYQDNQILASGFVEGGALSIATGNVTLIHVASGLYELDFTVPVTGIQHPLTVTPDACCGPDAPPTASVQWISLSPLKYYVRTYGFHSATSSFIQQDYNFTFILVP